MTTFIDINQVGRGVQLELAQSSLVETPNTPELITTTGAGTWTKPAGVTKVLVECWGGGGAGGGVTINDTGGDGGAGAQYARKLITYPSAQQSIAYFVAASSIGTTDNGVDGNDTTWDTNIVVAKGGAGGLANQTTRRNDTGSLGSTSGGIGDVVYSGGNGATGYFEAGISAAWSGWGGAGAGSTGPATGPSPAIPDFGGTGGGRGGVSNGGFDGLAGNVYGAGGSGAAKVSGPTRVGGNGAQGLIRITTYTSTVTIPSGVPIEMA